MVTVTLKAKLVAKGSATKWESRCLTSPRRPPRIVIDGTLGLMLSVVHHTSCICAPRVHKTYLRTLQNSLLGG